MNLIYDHQLWFEHFRFGNLLTMTLVLASLKILTFSSINFYFNPFAFLKIEDLFQLNEIKSKLKLFAHEVLILRISTEL